MRKEICFDMDGTIVDLYSVAEWLPQLRSESTRPYEVAKPLVDMDLLAELLKILKTLGWEVSVLSWGSKNATDEYLQRIREAKTEWLARYHFPADSIKVVEYGYNKSKLSTADYGVLIDDDSKVRAEWHNGISINPQTNDLLSFIETIIISEIDSCGSF